MRAIWSGMISFGLVNIPVKLYSAIEYDRLHFNYLHRKDLCPIGYRKVCRETGEEVPYGDIVKGYEYQKGDYVLLEKEDFEKASPEKSQAIQIVAFVQEDEIDLKLVERPYFLEPDKKAGPVYALFREALAKSKKVAVGRFVFKTKEQLVLLKPEGKTLIMIQMRFLEQIRSPHGLDLPESGKVDKEQLELAMELIKRLAKPFRPMEYKDTYTQELMALIEAKAKGKEPRGKAKKVKATTRVPDLIAKLKQSLKKTG